MRLLHTKKLELTEFIGTSVPEYVILSHRWEQDEVQYSDIQAKTANGREGYTKLTGACQQARVDGYDWIWIDTCCIDKTNSVELQEAINAMFEWYKDANICYAYLADVEVDYDDDDFEDSFIDSKWWTRSWTLR
jgi:hypothetical protein